MKILKNEKGFTLIDITVAIIVILLFMSLISILFFNLTKSSKGIERESQATYIATNVIEAFKQLDYDDVKITDGEVDILNYKDNNQNQIISVDIKEGYTATVKVEKYPPDSDDDLVKKIKVTVSYKLAAETKQVVLETSIVRK